MLYKITARNYKFIIGCSAKASELIADLETFGFYDVSYEEVESDTRTESEREAAVGFLKWFYLQ